MFSFSRVIILLIYHLVRRKNYDTCKTVQQAGINKSFVHTGQFPKKTRNTYIWSQFKSL